MVTSLKKSVTVDAPAEVAFRVFTQMKNWWPLDSHHIGKSKCVDAVIEPRVGGRWFEKGEDGSECEWGHVVAWEPPRRLVVTWEINADWKADATLKTEVEVQFIAEGPTKTRVELEHRHLDRFGSRADEMRGIFDSESGWTGMLQKYVKAAEAA